MVPVQVSSIAILGGGPSGLILARLLEINDIDYVIFERDESATAVTQGGSLDIHAGSGQLALKEAGLLDEFKAYARYDAPTIIVDKHGSVALTLGEGDESGRPEIDRRDLRNLLLNSIPSEKIQWGSQVQSVKRGEDGSMSIHLSDSRVFPGFKLVVGADGAWSKVRPLITSAKPQYSGLHFLETSILSTSEYYLTISARVGTGSYMGMGSGKQIAAQRNGNGSYKIYIGLRLPEHWSKEDANLVNGPALRSKLIEEDFSDWAHDLTDCIKYSEGQFRAWPLYAMPIESLSWRSVPGVTLIGDAAHVSTPFVGEGVNCAMHDSLQLAQEIVKAGTERLDEAVAAYEEVMLPRAIDLITKSTASGELIFAPDAPEGFRAMIAGMIASSNGYMFPCD